MKISTLRHCRIFFLPMAFTALSTGLSAQTYCAARGGPCGTQDNSWISSLSVSALNNTTACAATGYSNLTATAGIDVVRGSTYPITITEDGVTGQDVAGAWADWNQDGDLDDPDEAIPMSGTGLTPFTGNIVVPSGALLGSTRLRVRVLFSLDAPATTCGNTTYGEVEDYTIHVFNCSPTPGTPGTIGGQASICPGTSASYTIASVSNASTYTWTVASGMVINSGQGTTSITVTAGSSSGTVTVTAGNNCGTSATTTKAITVNSSPAANAGPDVNICSGKSSQLAAGGGTSYVWSPSTGLSNANISNPVASPAAMTHYTVTVTKNGCSATDELIVNVNPLPAANAGLDVSICAGGSTQLNANGGTSYLWSSSAGLSSASISNPFASPATSVTYTVIVTDANSCSANDVVMVTVNPNPVANAGVDAMICTGFTTQLAGSGGLSYAWSPSAGLSNPNIANPVASPTTTTGYTVTVGDSNGCQANDEAVVTVDPCTGVADPNADAAILLLPNPTSGIVHVISGEINIMEVRIMNFQGKTIYSDNDRIQNNSVNKAEVDLSGLPAGLYFLELRSREGTAVKKIIKN